MTPRSPERSEQRSEPDLDDVAADQEHDAAPGPGRGGHAGDDRAQVAGGEHVGQAVEECGERTVGAGRRGQQGGIDLVPAPGHGDGRERGSRSASR